MSSADTTQESSPSRRIFRFGAFEFDAQAHELRKHGLRIKLSGQPVSILETLLERPGEVVTREDLRKRLWPAGTYVDFEHGVNTAIKKLRQALGDSAESPRFIETLARTGYRFVAPLNQAADNAPPVAVGKQRRFVRLPAALAVVALLALIATTFAVLREKRGARTDSGSIRSLAVLPLANLSGDPSQEYFVEGMTDTLRQHLEGIRALRVVSRTSSIYYRGRNKPLREIAREMNVDAVVDGSVSRSGSRVRITVELIQAANDTRLWSGSYDRDLKDVFALQSEVAQKIASEMRVTLAPADRERLARGHTADPEAYLAYARGRFFWNRRTEKDFKKAIGYFQQAIERDPNYALAYDGLADCWDTLGWFGYLAPAETFPHAKAAVAKALDLDGSLAEAHTSLAGISHFYDRDWAAAEREFRRAIDLNPNYSNGHHWFSEFLSLVGRHEEAIAEEERARELDPLSVVISSSVGTRYFYARRYDKAIEQCRHAVEMDPKYVHVHVVLGHTFEQKHMFPEAIAELKKAAGLSSGSPLYLASLAHAYGVSGNSSEARKIRDRLVTLSKERYVSSFDLAVASLGMGETDRTFALLAQAVDERSPRVEVLGVDPRFDGLRGDARFKSLIARIGLPSH